MSTENGVPLKAYQLFLYASLRSPRLLLAIEISAREVGSAIIYGDSYRPEVACRGGCYRVQVIIEFLGIRTDIHS